MTLQGLGVRDALGMGEGGCNPSQLLGSCKGRGLRERLTPAEGRGWGGSSRCGCGGGPGWAAPRTEPDGRTGEGQPPAERASLASALPGCSTSRHCRCLPPPAGLHPSSRQWGIFPPFVGRAGGGTVRGLAPPLEGNEGAPAFEAEVFSLPGGALPQPPPSSRACSAGLRAGLPAGAPGRPSLPRPRLPSRAPLRGPDSPAGGAGLPSEQRRGPSPRGGRGAPQAP